MKPKSDIEEEGGVFDKAKTVAAVAGGAALFGWGMYKLFGEESSSEPEKKTSEPEKKMMKVPGWKGSYIEEEPFRTVSTKSYFDELHAKEKEEKALKRALKNAQKP